MPKTRPMPAPMAAIDNKALPAGTRRPTAVKPGLIAPGLGDPTAVVWPACSVSMKSGSVNVKPASFAMFRSSEDEHVHMHAAPTGRLCLQIRLRI